MNLMSKPLFKLSDLPMEELEHLELARDGKLLLSEADQKALLAGRRTLQIPVPGINHVPTIDAKLSLLRNTAGEAELRLHPIYKNPTYPEELTDVEAEKLINGEATVIARTVQKPGQPDRKYLFEFDPDTREFIRTDPEKIELPDRVNDETLTAAQKETLRKGKEVELSDGTRFRFTGVDPLPFRASKGMLIASLLLDGGISYVFYKGLRSLTGAKQEEKQEAYSLGYRNALEDMERAENQLDKKPVDGLGQKTGDVETRGYSRSGRAR